MKILKTSLKGVLIIKPCIFKDSRGCFMETYHKKRYNEAGINHVFVQDNFSHSIQGTLRGLHYQLQHPQAKLVQVIKGEIYDVVVDIRCGSSTFGQWVGFNISDKNKNQILIPEGFAHGFCVISETADVVYKCTDFYSPDDESGIIYSDSVLNINWPVKYPLLSVKDSQYSCLNNIPHERLPIYLNKV